MRNIARLRSNSVKRRLPPWSALEVLVLAVCAGGLTWVAWEVRPNWDDGWLWLQRLEGDDTLYTSMGDRPVLGWAWWRLASYGLLEPASAALHWIGWFGLAACTRVLWRRLFPALPQLGLPAGLLPMSTVLLQIQLVLINPVWGSLIGPVLVYTALWILWARDEVPWRGRVWPLRSLAAIAVVLAALLSEYGVVASVACAVLVAGVGHDRRSDRTDSRRVVVGVLLVAAALGYALFLGTSDPSVRLDTRPGEVLDIGSKRLLALPFLLLTEFWQGIVGTLLAGWGTVEVSSIESLITALASAAAAAAVYWIVRRGWGAPQPEESRTRVIGALAAASTVGMLMILAAGRVPWAGVSSRYLIPLAPLFACLSLRFLWSVAQTRFRRPLLGALIFVVFFVTFQDVREARDEHRRLSSVGEQVRPHLDAGGFTLVILLQPERAVVSGREGYELTARIGARLPLRTRSRIWAVRYEELDEEGVEGVELASTPRGAAQLRRRLRGLDDDFEITRVIWVDLRRDSTRIWRDQEE